MNSLEAEKKDLSMKITFELFFFFPIASFLSLLLQALNAMTGLIIENGLHRKYEDQIKKLK